MLACGEVRAACVAAVCAPSIAVGFAEAYGGHTICGNNCYVQWAAAAHVHRDAVGDATYLACQLFNHSGSDNSVRHADVVDGTFAISTTTPRAGQPTPTSPLRERHHAPATPPPAA